MKPGTLMLYTGRFMQHKPVYAAQIALKTQPERPFVLAWRDTSVFKRHDKLYASDIFTEPNTGQA